MSIRPFYQQLDFMPIMPFMDIFKSRLTCNPLRMTWLEPRYLLSLQPLL